MNKGYFSTNPATRKMDGFNATADIPTNKICSQRIARSEDEKGVVWFWTERVWAIRNLYSVRAALNRLIKKQGCRQVYF